MDASAVDKEAVKSALEEIMHEDNPAWNALIEELMLKLNVKVSASSTALDMDMELIRARYAVKKEVFDSLQELFEDAPPAEQILPLLTK